MSLLHKERDNLVARNRDLEAEQNEIKVLLEELAQERSHLVHERNSLRQGAQRSRETLASLENHVTRLVKETKHYKARATELEKELNATKAVSNEVHCGMKAASTEHEKLVSQIEGFRALTLDLQKRLEWETVELSRTRERYEAKSSEVKKNEAALNIAQAELRQSEMKIKEISAMLLEREAQEKIKADQIRDLRSLLKEKPKSVAARADPPVGSKAQKESTSAYQANRTAEKISPQTEKTSTGKVSPMLAMKGQPAETGFQPRKPRKVPLRKLRKLFAKTTGIHGAFTKPSRQRGEPPRPNLSKSVKANAPRGEHSKIPDQRLPQQGPPRPKLSPLLVVGEGVNPPPKAEVRER